MSPVCNACVLTMLLALGGCAAQPTEVVADPADRIPLRARCLRIADVDNWRVIDSRNLIVYGPRRDDAWHAVMFGSCIRLPMAETIAFHSRGSTELCGRAGDEILLRGERCAIRSLQRISPAEAALLLDRNVRGDIGKLPPAAKPEGERKQ